MNYLLSVRSVCPLPTDQEMVAIVEAVTEFWPHSARVRIADTSATWRFSGRLQLVTASCQRQYLTNILT